MGEGFEMRQIFDEFVNRPRYSGNSTLYIIPHNASLCFPKDSLFCATSCVHTPVTAHSSQVGMKLFLQFVFINPGIKHTDARQKGHRRALGKSEVASDFGRSQSR